MKKHTLLRALILTGASAALAISRYSVAADGEPSNAAAIRVTTGNTFTLVPTSNANVFGHPVDRVAQISLMGNCHFHREANAYLPTSAGQPIRILSTTPWTLTSSDGVNSLKFDTGGRFYATTSSTSSRSRCSGLPRFSITCHLFASSATSADFSRSTGQTILCTLPNLFWR